MWSLGGGISPAASEQVRAFGERCPSLDLTAVTNARGRREGLALGETEQGP